MMEKAIKAITLGTKWPGRAALAAVVLVYGLALAACDGGGGQEHEQAAQASPVSGEFVGEVPDMDAFLALVADKPKGGERKREVSAYLCDGKRLTEWFTGTASAGEVRLGSESGGHVDATIGPENTAGTITLSTGDSFDFEAPRATGVDGFYPVSVPPEGPLNAISWSGARLQGTRTDEEITGTITLPKGGGEAAGFRISVPTIEEGDNRWIVLTGDGQFKIKGAKKGAASTGYIDPTTDI